MKVLSAVGWEERSVSLHASCNVHLADRNVRMVTRQQCSEVQLARCDPDRNALFSINILLSVVANIYHCFWKLRKREGRHE